MRDLTYKHERPLLTTAAVISILFWTLLFVGTLGMAAIYAGFFFVTFLFARSAFISYLKGTAVRVTPDQFPDIYGRLEDCCRTLGIQVPPEIYLMHADGAFNAFATRFLGRDFVVLFSDVVDALEDRPEALNFYIGHELGHLHRKHLIWGPWLAPAMLLPLLGAAYSRAREYTCDNYGYECCDNPEDALVGIAVLSSGAKRWKSLNRDLYAAQTQETSGFWMSFNELIGDYPWLVKRMARLMAKAEGRSEEMPGRHGFAWFLALFIPRLGVGAGGAASMMIVIAMMGILAAVAIPAFINYQKRAAETAASETASPYDIDTEVLLQQDAPAPRQPVGETIPASENVVPDSP